MTFFQKLLGFTSGNGVEVTANNRLKVELEPDAGANPGQVGGVRLFSENDDGTVTGTADLRSPEVSDDYRLRVGMDQSLFNIAFEGTNIARDRIQQNDTTATSAQASGFLTINSGGSTTSGQGSNIRSYRTFPMYGSYPLYCETWAKIDNYNATNVLAEWGLGFCSGVTAQLTDGVFLRLLSGGQLRLVVTNNSTDIIVQDITTTNIPPRDGVGAFDWADNNHFVIVVHNDEIHVWINDSLVATSLPTATVPMPTNASALPYFARVYNSGTASAARKLNIGFINVSMGDQSGNKPWMHALCGLGQGAYQIQPGTASGPNVTRGASATAGWPNSAQARGAGTWTATTAPAINSLGGQWQSPAISTLTSEADYPVFSFQNPAGSATLPGKTLYITGVRWGKTVATAAASTNSINLDFIVGCGGTSSASTATEAAAVVAARGTYLDTIPFKATAVVGDYVEGGFIQFDAPLVVYPGHFLVFIVRPWGTVTSNTLVVNGSVGFVGYFE